MKDLKIKKCRSCGAPIVWIKTTAGKYMPCDATPDYYRITGESDKKIVTPEGEVLTGEVVNNPWDADEYGYTPHWSTCNAPDKFRNKGGASK